VRDSSTLLKTKRGIIIAADVSTIDDLRRLSELGGQVDGVAAIKVGFSLALRYGLPSVVSAVKDTSDLLVIYDHQKAGTDIPKMGQVFADVCFDAGVQGTIFFPQAGPRTLEAFVIAAFERGLTPIVGLVMTHPAYLQSDGGFISETAPARICETAKELGVRSFVLPGNKPDIVANFSKGLLMSMAPVEVMMPGIGGQGGSIAGAFKAAKGHRPFAIIGSAIYKAADPGAALKRFVEESKS
jgi:orotidine-5'-phosphate decarboxylase